MSYKINSIPSSKAYKEETADYWEVQAIKNQELPVSNLSILKLVSKEFDELDNNGLLSEEDLYDDTLVEVFDHIKDRKIFTNLNYPFTINRASIVFKGCQIESDYLYVFLLFATRFNMKTNRKHGGIDGADLFEEICVFVAKSYFGNNAEAIIFGTADKKGFEKKVNALIKKLGEGESFKNRNDNPPLKNDDSVDIVVWKNFADNKKGKLIGFGQCKTGTTSWRSDIHKLKPTDFCTKWFYQNPVFEPLPIVFLTDTMNDQYNFYSAQKGFLIFNRFRIMEYAKDAIPQEISRKVKVWVDNAMQVVFR